MKKTLATIAAIGMAASVAIAGTTAVATAAPAQTAATTAPNIYVPTVKVTWKNLTARTVWVTNPYNGQNLNAGTLYQRQSTANKNHVRYDLYLRTAINVQQKVKVLNKTVTINHTFKPAKGDGPASFFLYHDGKRSPAQMGVLNMDYYAGATKQLRDAKTNRVIPIQSLKRNHRLVVKIYISQDGQYVVKTNEKDYSKRVLETTLTIHVRP